MGFTFSNEHADRAERFFASELRFVEGAKAGQPFTLQPWQAKIVRDLFGWIRDDGSRKYRTAYIEIPRKCGKSTLAAGLALYMLLCDREHRPQVYSAAGDRGQARIVFNAARAMVEANERLGERAELRQYEIRGRRNGGWYEALSAEAYTKHGLSASGIIFDELHVQPNRELWDVLTTSTGARSQPLTVAITTAGYDRSSICWEMHQRAVAALQEPDSDPYFYPVIYGAESDEDWTAEATWYKANPNLGISLSIEYLREKCNEAQKNPAAENTFRNLHLNQWTQQAVRWLPMRQWDECETEFTAAEMEHQPCWAGLDLAATRDVNAFVLVFRPTDNRYRILPFFWAPAELVDARGEQDRRRVMNWAKQGFVTLTPGNIVDYEVIAQDIAALCERFGVQQIAYDPWGPAVSLTQRLEQFGISPGCFIKFVQTISNFAAPTKELETLVADNRFEHDGNPLLRWMAENVVVRQDPSGNIRPDKGNSSEKIDGIVAAIMGLGLAMKGESVTWFNETNALEIG